MTVECERNGVAGRATPGPGAEGVLVLGGPADSAAAMLDALPSPMALLDAEGVITRVNRSWSGFSQEHGGLAGRTGVGVSYLAACEQAAAQGDPDAATVLAGLREVAGGRRSTFTHDYECSHGPEHRWFQLDAAAAEGVGVGWTVVVHTDITNRVRSENAYWQQSRQDQLTGLANRLRIYEVLGHELDASSASRPLTVLFLDVDNFKNVNDSLGHDVGDLLLMDLASRLVKAVRPGHLLGRLGGDEFVLVAPGCPAERAADAARGLTEALGDPFDVAGMHLPVTVSIGSATAAGAPGRVGDLLRDADAALYAAKAAGRDRHRAFTPDLHEAASERLSLATGLRRALRHDELVLHYQPVVDLRTGRVGGFEALMRWQHPTRGLLGPDVFIPLAEETGLIVPLSRWLLVEASRQGAQWAGQGFDGRLSVNISAAHLATGTLTDDVLEGLEVTGFDPTRLILEITETALTADPASAARQLNGLRHVGVQVAIDDFGAGYSSLGQLASLPADILKLDRSLLPAGDRSPLSQTRTAIARAVVQVADSMGLLVHAEGVETEAELEGVRQLGCALAQGYLLGRPTPSEQVRF